MNYSAVVYNKKSVRVFNSITGTIVSTINIGANIIGSPIVNGNKLAVVTEPQPGNMYNTVYEIPSGKQITKNKF